MPFPGIVNGIVRVEFELANYNVAVPDISHCATGIRPTVLVESVHFSGVMGSRGERR